MLQTFRIENRNGIWARVAAYGGRIMSLNVPDRNGEFSDVVAGYDRVEEYETSNEHFYGAAIGRFGNRIARGRFFIGEAEYNLEKNDGNNCLHGGFGGFHKVIWDVSQLSSAKLELTHISKDMEEGFPGNIRVRMTYEITDNNELKIEYFAKTDKKTVLNLTNHSFFNLTGDFRKSINDHLLEIQADYITPVNKDMIPTGEFLPVAGTPFDFSGPEVIGLRVNDDHEQLKYGLGYDHNWIIRGEPDESGIRFAARVKEPKSGRVLKVFTNEPGIQFYGGNFLNGSDVGKGDTPYGYRTAFCLETQHFPDSPNQEKFPTTILDPSGGYYSICIYCFETIKQE